MAKSENPWSILSNKVVYDNKWIRVEDYKVINPAGSEGIYGKVHFKNIAVGIIPLDSDKNTWLVGQYRFPLGQFSWEIPEGGCPDGSEPQDAAKRELKEETGLVAASWSIIQELHLSNSVSDERAVIFLAEDLRQEERDLEPTELGLQVKKLPFGEALGMVSRGEITDSISVAGILSLARLKGW